MQIDISNGTHLVFSLSNDNMLWVCNDPSVLLTAKAKAQEAIQAIDRWLEPPSMENDTNPQNFFRLGERPPLLPR